MKKLHNERGETILMVLLLLVLATMVSAVVLAAAVSSAKNMHTDREAQQNYLTVSSAAELVRESILGKTYSRTETTIERTWLDEEGQEHSSTSTSVAYKRPDGLMAPWLNDCIDDDAERTIFRRSTIELSAVPSATSGEDSSGKLKTVQAVYTMDDDFNITIIFSLPDAGDNDCVMTLEVKGTKTVGTPKVVSLGGDSGTKTEQETSITWNSAKISKGASA